jgi:hypothetical protein
MAVPIVPCQLAIPREHSLCLLSPERSSHTLGKSLCSLHTTSHEEKCCRPRLRRFDKPPVLIDFVLAKWTELIDPDYLCFNLEISDLTSR